MKTKKLTIMSMLLCISLIIFIVEAQLPPLAPIPGIKPGLANTVTLFALFMLGRKEAFIILLLRIIMACIFTGNMSTFMYSFAGGMLCFSVICILSLFWNEDKLWIISIFGAISHNTGQILTAWFIMGRAEIIWYLLPLIISAVITGFFTGMVTKFTLNRLHKNNIKDFK